MKQRLQEAEHIATVEHQAHRVTLDLLKKRTSEARKLRRELVASEKATPSSQGAEGASASNGGEGGVAEALKAA
jgi:hypothetical protein